jgi:hypothetical protein
MELAGRVKQGKHQDRAFEAGQVVALTTRGPNVTVLAHVNSPIGAPGLDNPQ